MAWVPSSASLVPCGVGFKQYNDGTFAACNGGPERAPTMPTDRGFTVRHDKAITMHLDRVLAVSRKNAHHTSISHWTLSIHSHKCISGTFHALPPISSHV